MRIGVPREVKDGERRVGLTPAAVRALAEAGHEVVVEAGCGTGVGASDRDYQEAGARVGDVQAAWQCELVVKVKDIQPGEEARIPSTATFLAYLQLAAAPERTRALAARGATAIAYELVRDRDGALALLAPMSAMSGRMAIQVGAHLLALHQGGNGTLLAAVPGTTAACVLVLGAGHAGSNAADVAVAIGAKVTVLCRSDSTRAAMRRRFGERAGVGIATPEAIEREALRADLVIGAASIAGQPTPKLLPRALVARMKRGAVLVDIAIDAGGVAETSRPTTHDAPTYVEEGVVHYCVPNMPAAYARSATDALVAATLPSVTALAAEGIEGALRRDAGLRAGVVLWKGRVVHPGIAAVAGMPCARLEEFAP